MLLNKKIKKIKKDKEHCKQYKSIKLRQGMLLFAWICISKLQKRTEETNSFFGKLGRKIKEKFSLFTFFIVFHKQKYFK